MTARPALRIVTDPATELARLMAEKERGLRIAALADEKMNALAKSWGDANGYRVRLNPEQMRKALEARDE